MSTLKDLRNIRLEKLRNLQEKGINPYPANSYRNTCILDIHENYGEKEGSDVVVSGRVVSIREHSNLMFVDIKDSTGKVQLYIKPDNFVEADYKDGWLKFEDLSLIDTGDFVEARGVVTKTQRGEVSVEISGLRILTKSLRPLPDSHDGFKDKETRLRRRYLDTTVNEDVYQRFSRRAKFWEAHREFFKEHGFLEMNIPVLENVPGGADAKPFVTHMDSIDQDFYLRISQELYLKRLIGGGYEKVYEIGPRFRNEGYSDEHLPEHMAMEFYWAYANWKDGMEMVKDLFSHVLERVYNGRQVFQIRGFEVDFSKGWEVIDFAEIMQDKYGFDVYNTTVEEVSALLDKHHVEKDFDLNLARGIDNLWKNLRKDIKGPAFLVNHPKFMSPLAKSHAQNPQITERFQPIIAGSELGNGWSEITDPQDQLARFRQQQEMRNAGDEEAQWLDIDYVEMLEYGMPPTFGYGHSERTFWFLEDVTAREGVPFPQLRHEIDDTTREIYGLKGSGDGESLGESDGVQTENSGGFNGSAGSTGQATGDASGSTEDSSDDVSEEDLKNLPTREEAHKLLEEYVTDDYQKHHAKMVATVMEAYAKELGQNEDLWFVTGLLHDLDYTKYPKEHPNTELEWFRKWNYPHAFIHAVEAHGHSITGAKPQSTLAKTLLASDELTGFLYAYSLMRPEKFEGMKASSAAKKLRDKSFAPNINREEVQYGVEMLGKDLSEHLAFVIKALQEMKNA